MNFHTICRICLCNNTEMVSIFDSYNFSRDNCEILKVITNCASVQIEKFDGFSKRICRSCLAHLSQAYSFKKLCEESDLKFRSNSIVSDEIEIKSEFYECNTNIILDKIHNYIDENTYEISKTAEFELTEVKQEQCDVEIKTGWNQNEVKKENDSTPNEVPSHLNKEEKSYSCEICGKKFTSSQNLAVHSRTHTGEKPFQCEFCDKNFSHSSNLSRHVRLHTGEKPYQCDFCDKKFTQSSTLTAHVRQHTGEKPYKCEFCQKDFTRRSHLITHVRLHTGEKRYKCDFCKKKFTCNGNLAVHIRTHTGEQPFKCEFCEKTFTNSSSLTRHIRSHTGEKPYKCDYCEKKFAKRITLSTHISSVHTEEK